MNKLVIGISGASGSIYALRLLHKLQAVPHSFTNIGIVASSNAGQVWQHELDVNMDSQVPYPLFTNTDFNAPFASGSAGYNHMVIIPCSMGTIGKIAAGTSGDLMSRAADVILKERGKLILVARETPYNAIHLQNMLAVTQAGAIVCPATPSFYSKPQNINQLADTVVDRVLQLLGLTTNAYRWGE